MGLPGVAAEQQQRRGTVVPVAPGLVPGGGLRGAGNGIWRLRQAGGAGSREMQDLGGRRRRNIEVLGTMRERERERGGGTVDCKTHTAYNSLDAAVGGGGGSYVCVVLSLSELL